MKAWNYFNIAIAIANLFFSLWHYVTYHTYPGTYALIDAVLTFNMVTSIIYIIKDNDD